MRVVNAMFGRRKGGIEQAFVDYSTALTMQGNDVLSIAHPHAAILPQLQKCCKNLVLLKNHSQWDIWAVWKLRKHLHSFNPDVIITHGNRATVLLMKAATGKVPVVGICHNYSLKHLLSCDGLLTITDHLRDTVIAAGKPADRVYTVPNMIHVPDVPPHRPGWRTPPVIGAMGRFVAKKGFDVFIDALALLKQEGVPFRAMLGGGGEEEARLRQRASQAGLEGQLVFTGWVEDKQAFFDACDIFCLPSSHEPFGIVLLEALLQCLPVVSTCSEGPREIVSDGQDALLVPIGDAPRVKEALTQLLHSEEYSRILAVNGYHRVVSRYDMQVVGEQLQQALGGLVTKSS